MGTQDNEDDRPQFMRKNMPDHVELRVWVPKNVVGAIDGEVICRGGEGANVYRATIVEEILRPWAEKKVHDARVMIRVADSNPTGLEQSGTAKARS